LIVSRQAYSRALLRVDFAVIDRSATKLADNGHADVARATARMLSRALTDERLSDREHIAQFGFDAMDVAKLRVACTNLLRDSWNLGAQEAGNEMAKAGRKEMRRKFAVSSTLDIAKAYLDSNSFRMAGNLSDGARSIIQQELVNALKGDKTFVETREAILDRLLRKGFTDLQSVGEFFPEDVHQALSEALGGEGYKGTDASYIDTLIRTNVFDAMNQGRLESFRDPDIGDFVQALEYASVLDDHTTEICTELNGATWSTDNPLWDTYMPPNHYNCRSVVIPITQVDGWDGQESPVPEVQPQDGFK
jgi:SPP1 gp7 family putative phage head morphogenesis protein